MKPQLPFRPSGASQHPTRRAASFTATAAMALAMIFSALPRESRAEVPQMTPTKTFTSVPFKDSVAEMVARDQQQGFAPGAEPVVIEAPRGDFAPLAPGPGDGGQGSKGNAHGAVTQSAVQTLSTSFETVGLANAIQGFIPPDTCGAVGPNHFVEIINGSVAIYTRAGVQLSNVNPNTFFAATFAAVNYPRLGSFDPRVIFDRRSGRWMAVILERGAVSGQQNEVILAVSATDDPTGVWNKYLITVGQPTVGADTFFTDYDTLGTDDNGVYIGVRIFKSTSGSFVSSNATIAAVPKAQVLVAGPATVSTFASITDMFSTPQPAHNQDAVGVSDRAWFVASSSSTFSNLRYRSLTWSGAVPTLDATSTTLTTPAFAAALNAPASGSTTNINCGDARLQMAVIRNNSLWTCRNVGVNSTGGSTSADRTGCEWLQLNVSAAAATLTQSGRVFDPAAATPFYYFYPSIMVNGQGHAVMGFSGVQSTGFVGAFFTGRLTGDGAGTMGTVDIIKAGEASYQQIDGSGRNRWGDYSYTSLDPNDDMSIWTIQEYAESVAANRWGTWVAKTLAPPPATPLSCSPASVAPGLASVSVTVTGSVNSGSGFYDPGAGYLNRIAGAVTGITVNSITYNSPTSVTLDLNTTAASPGAKDVTITNPDGQARTGVGILSVVPNNLVLPAATEGGTSHSTPLNSAERTLQLAYDDTLLASVPVGTEIVGMQFRLDGTDPTWPSTARNFANYDVQISTSLNAPGSLAGTYASNIAGNVVTVRSGPLAIAANSYGGGASPNAFGPVINFTTPFIYNGGDLLITIRHTGNGVDSPFLDANANAAGLYQGQATNGAGAYSSGTSNGATANTTVVQLNFAGTLVSPPAPVTGSLGDVVTGANAADGTGADSGLDYDMLTRGGYIAENGHLAFPGELTGPGVDGTNFKGFWKHNGTLLSRFARTGDNAPETGATAAKFSDLPLIPGINDAGQVTLLASLATNPGSTPPTTADNDTGLWSELGGTGFQILMREGDDIPGLLPVTQVGRFGSGCFATADTGAGTAQAAFTITMKGASTDTALLRASILGSSVTAVGVVARENASAPGTGETFGFLNSTYTGAVRMDAQGNIVFGAALKPSNKSSLWYQPVAGGAPSAAVVVGNAAPGTTGATFAALDLPVMGGSGTFAFRGVLNRDGDNADNSKNDGIWRGTATGPFTNILRRGDSNTNRPGLFSATYTGTYPSIKAGNIYNGWLTNANHGAWLGWVDLGGNGISGYAYDGNFTAATDTFGVYTDISGTMTLLISSGDPAPGIAGAKLFFVDHPVVSGTAPTEHLAFVATVTGGGTTAANNKGIWRSLNGAAPTLVLRTGDSMTVTPGGAKTIDTLDLPGSGYPDHIWETPVMDANGRLLVFVTFTDGTTTQVIVP